MHFPPLGTVTESVDERHEAPEQPFGASVPDSPNPVSPGVSCHGAVPTSNVGVLAVRTSCTIVFGSTQMV